MDVRARFESYISVQDDGCWLWMGGRSTNGYGQFSLTEEPGRYRKIGAHRFAYELYKDPIPE